MLAGIVEALKYVVELAEERIDPEVELDGRDYTTRKLTPVLEPGAPRLEVHTLAGLVEYAEAAIPVDGQEVWEAEFPNGLAAIVRGPREVALVSAAYGGHRQRDVYAVAKPVDGDGFRFGSWMKPLDFQIALLAMFADGGDRGDIIKAVGSLKDEAIRTLEDDGITQVATVKAGATVSTEVPINNPVELCPFRTFADVAQPTGRFVLRVEGGGGEPFKLALFEVDDGKWRRECIQRIKDYLSEELTDVPVIG